MKYLEKNKRRLIIAFCLLITSFLILFIGKNTLFPEGKLSSQFQIFAQTSTDWPQLMHDPQRTGYTSQEVRPPYRYLWRWHEVPFAIRTSPVVANGILSIGSLNGKMYALDAKADKNGQAPSVLWTFTAGGPIRASAAIYEGKVFFGSHDGFVYALNSQNGNLVWKYKTGEGLMTFRSESE